MSRDLRCLRCGGEMGYTFTDDIQLGRTSVLFGNWPNIRAGAMQVDIYRCKECGKLEFFTAEAGGDTAEDIPQTTCPICGSQHDFDYPKCPFCKHEY